MFESQSMTSAEVVAKALIEEHPDLLRESVAMVAHELMEAEISSQIGAGKGEIAEARSTHRNGYRPRPWATRVGEIELAIPPQAQWQELLPELPGAPQTLREGAPGRGHGGLRHGVSTRKVDHLVSELGIHCRKTRSPASAASSTIRSRPSAPARWRAPIPTSGSTPST